MKTNNYCTYKGMTFVEVILYVFLISFLLSTFIEFAYSSQERNYKLFHEINDEYDYK